MPKEEKLDLGDPTNPEVDVDLAGAEDGTGVETTDAPDPKAAKEAKAVADEIKELRKDRDAQAKRASENESAAQYWAERARAGAGDGKETAESTDDTQDLRLGELVPKAADPPDAEDPDGFLDELSKKGSGAVVADLKKRGLLQSPEELVELMTKVAQRVATRERGKATTDAELAANYGDLKDENSPLFKATARKYQELVRRDPALKKSGMTALMAAEAAKLELELEAARNGKAGEHYEIDQDREQARRDRISAQSSDGRSRSSRSDIEDEDDTLSDNARTLIAQLESYGVTEKNYKAQRARERKAARER